MDISTTQYKRCDVCKPIGRIDAYSAPALEQTLNKITDEGRFTIVLDMSEVDFLSSRGLWVLTEIQKKCKRYNRGQIVLARPRVEVKDTFKIAGMEHYFNFYDDLISAVASF